uniref:Uncharacterized protein n=1 Tax=Solanum tuberosum TaxID=4113 RepID=M1A185_SOLTU
MSESSWASTLPLHFDDWAIEARFFFSLSQPGYPNRVVQGLEIENKSQKAEKG